MTLLATLTSFCHRWCWLQQEIQNRTAQLTCSHTPGVIHFQREKAIRQTQFVGDTRTKRVSSARCLKLPKRCFAPEASHFINFNNRSRRLRSSNAWCVAYYFSQYAKHRYTYSILSIQFYAIHMYYPYACFSAIKSVQSTTLRVM